MCADVLYQYENMLKIQNRLIPIRICSSIPTGDGSSFKLKSVGEIASNRECVVRYHIETNRTLLHSDLKL